MEIRQDLVCYIDINNQIIIALQFTMNMKFHICNTFLLYLFI